MNEAVVWNRKKAKSVLGKFLPEIWEKFNPRPSGRDTLNDLVRSGRAWDRISGIHR
jgi:hypothetical protein